MFDELESATLYAVTALTNMLYAVEVICAT